MSTSQPITDEQQAVLSYLRNPLVDNLALVATTFNGEPVTVIASISFDGAGYNITPHAILLEGTNLHDRLIHPEAAANITDSPEGYDQD